MASFDIEHAIQESQLLPETIDTILREVRADYPDDSMMYELKVIRAINAERARLMGPQQWDQHVNLTVQTLRQQHDLELVLEPLETAPRLKRKLPEAG